MTFEDIEKLVLDYRDIETDIKTLDIVSKKVNKQKQEELTKQLDEIKFKLELPYKLLELIAEAQKENIVVEATKEPEITVSFKDLDGRYTTDITLNTANEYDYSYMEELVNELKYKKLEEDRKYKLRITALAKLTNDEKIVLGLN